jgi:WD40 repeat protein
VSVDEDEGNQLAVPGPAKAAAAGDRPPGEPSRPAEQASPAASRVHVQTAQAAESAVVVQVGGDLYLSDSALTSLWTPAQTTSGDCPYPGLDAYGPGQAKWFFGRETVTGELLRYLDAMARGGPGGPLLVVAPSGTGKSSLLGAGLLNALAEGRLPDPGSAAWPRLMITPGSQPQRTLSSALATLASAQTAVADSRFVVVIDQLEEIFTLCESERERADFLDEIGTLAADAGPGSALVVLGMRADFYAQAAAYPVLRQSMQSRQVVLGAMSAAEVRQAVIRPARAVGLTLEAGLTDRLLRDLGVDEGADPAADEGTRAPDEGASAGGSYEPGRLPLLAHALRATWRHRDGSRLTIAGYEATGGIGGAIARTADDVYAGLDGPGQTATRQLFLGLVRIGAATGDGTATADTRRRVAADDLLAQAADVAAAQAALAAFTAARLLTWGSQAVEITHEALLRRWPRLRAWIDEDRAGLTIRQELEDAAASWAREGRDPAGLYGGVRLAAAQGCARLASAGGGAPDPARLRELTQPGREFLGAAERRRRRGVRRRNGIIAVLTALSLVLAGLSVFALNQRSAAQSSFTKASAALLAAEAGQAWADYRPDTGLRFAVQAYRLDPSSPQVLSTLLTTQAVPIAGRLLVNGANQETNVVATAFNPAGTVIAGTTQDDHVQLWSAATRQLLWNFRFPAIARQYPQANDVAFSPTGQIMAVTQPGGPWLFDVSDPAHPVHVATLKLPAVTGDPDPQVTSLAYSPDGSTLAAGISTNPNDPSTGVVLLWNTSTRALSGLIPEQSLASSVAFTPDGRSLLVTIGDGGVDLWDIAQRTKTVVQAQLSSDASGGGAAVSPNGQTIAFGTENANGAFAVKLWSVATQQVTATANVNGAEGIDTVAFSPGGTQFAAAGFDGTVRLWQVPAPGGTPVVLGNFSGHRYPIEHIAFSPDGATLASASDDGSIGLWDTRGTLLDAAVNPSTALAFSPDGATLAISTFVAGQVAVALYSMPARKLERLLPATSTAALAFSPDGKTLAVAPAGAAGDPVQLWDVATGRLTGQFTTGLTSRVNSMAFSPDGTLLAVSAEQSTTMQVWSTASLARVAAFSDTQDTDYSPQLGGGVFTLAFSPDGRLLAVVGIDGLVRVYSVPGFAPLIVFRPLDSTTSLSFSPNGRELALGNSDGNVYVYSIPASYTDLPAQLKFQGTLSASTKSIYAVEFLPNGTLAAAGADGIVRFWTVPSAAFNAVTIPAESLNTHVGAIASLSYSAPLGLLATASPLGSRVWQANPAQVAASICQTLKTPVSAELWREYLPDIPYTPVCG